MTKILFLLMMLSAIDGFAQEDTLFRRNSFIPLPVFGYSPEKGFEFGAGLYYSFFTDKADPIPRTRNSTVRVSGTFRSEEHTSELQSLMRISYAVFCLKKKR